MKVITVISSLCLVITTLASEGCAPEALSFPDPLVIKPPPISLTDEKMANDYKNDPILADAKYLDKEVLFDRVTVESVHTIYNQAGPGMQFGFIVDYFTCGNISFQLLDFRGAQQNIQVGYILDLQGFCRGPQTNGYIFINDCWYQSIEGNIGTEPIGIGGY